MKSFLLYVCFALMAAIPCKAQIREVMIGVNGLTCSQCTRNVEMQLRRLPFVQDVAMNLQHTNGVIKLKPGARVLPESIAKSVKDAGFSLRYLRVTLDNPNQYSAAGGCFSVSGLAFQLAPSTRSLPGVIHLQLLGEPFQPKKDIGPLPVRTCTVNGRVYFAAISNE